MLPRKSPHLTTSPTSRAPPARPGHRSPLASQWAADPLNALHEPVSRLCLPRPMPPQPRPPQQQPPRTLTGGIGLAETRCLSFLTIPHSAVHLLLGTGGPPASALQPPRPRALTRPHPLQVRRGAEGREPAPVLRWCCGWEDAAIAHPPQRGGGGTCADEAPKEMQLGAQWGTNETCPTLGGCEPRA